MVLGRALHYVFKVGDRGPVIRFYRDVLGMKVLRHEEFEEGCKASCNGPYDGKWSKTMVGYGSEDNHFVSELTYNYGVGEYRLGNDFLGITLQSSEAVSNAKREGWPLTKLQDATFVTEAPGGYIFYLVNKDQPETDPVQKVTLAVSDLQRAIKYWCDVLGMKVYEKNDSKKQVLLGYADDQLPGIESQIRKEKHKILTALVSLETPGKATVDVVILADPDGHEICLVGDEGFRDLSKVDPAASKLLDDAIAADKSNEWFAEHRNEKPSA